MMRPNARYHGRPTDVYALGACMYTLLFGRIPFSAPSLPKLFQVGDSLIPDSRICFISCFPPSLVPCWGCCFTWSELRRRRLEKGGKEGRSLPVQRDDAPLVDLGGGGNT